MSTYYVESFVPAGADAWWLGTYLLDLMQAHGYEVVSEVRLSHVAPELVPYPGGRVLIRAEVTVREWDVEV